MTEANKALQNQKAAILYTLWLFITWTIYVMFFYKQYVKLNTYSNIVGETVRILLFAAPLFIVYKKTDFPTFNDLGFDRNFLKDLSIGIAFALVFIAIFLPLTMLLKGKPLSAKEVSGVPLWSALSLAVIVEEVVFRGYLLNLLTRYGKIRAVIISSVLFVFIHYPGWWFLEMQPSLMHWVSSSISIFVLGILLGSLFLKFRALWICILIHSANNLIAKIAG